MKLWKRLDVATKERYVSGACFHLHRILACTGMRAFSGLASGSMMYICAVFISAPCFQHQERSYSNSCPGKDVSAFFYPSSLPHIFNLTVFSFLADILYSTQQLTWYVAARDTC